MLYKNVPAHNRVEIAIFFFTSSFHFTQTKHTHTHAHGCHSRSWNIVFFFSFNLEMLIKKKTVIRNIHGVDPMFESWMSNEWGGGKKKEKEYKNDSKGSKFFCKKKKICILLYMFSVKFFVSLLSSFLCLFCY